MMYNMNNSKGYIAGFLILAFIAFLMVSWVVYSIGSTKQSSQKELLEKGYNYFNSGKIDKSIKCFTDALDKFGFPLKIYRIFNKSDENLSEDDINLVIVNACISVSYDNFFKLDSSEKLIKKAKQTLNQISEKAQGKELKKLVATADSCSKLCSLYKKNKIKKALKDLLKVENKSAKGDVDFFIFEIKLMIECGKRLQSQMILGKARELLFFLSYELKIQNDKTNSLWKSLTKM